MKESEILNFNAKNVVIFVQKYIPEAVIFAFIDQSAFPSSFLNFFEISLVAIFDLLRKFWKPKMI